MASAAPFTDELTCPICLGLFQEPVILGCGHNFCRACISQYWGNRRRNVSCPECRQLFGHVRGWKRNRVLANLSETASALQQEMPETGPDPETCCPEHGERLKLLCVTDDQLVCLICRDGQGHRGHSFVPLRDAADTRKVQLKKSLKFLKTKEEFFSEAQRIQEKDITEVKTHSTHLINNIQTQFAKLHQFLTEREQKLIQDVRQKEEFILQTMERNLVTLLQEVHSLQWEMEKLQALIDQQDELLFLKTVKKNSVEPDCHKTSSSVDAPSHWSIKYSMSLGLYEDFLQFTVWKELRKIITPAPLKLKLMPWDANFGMIISRDLTSVRQTDNQRFFGQFFSSNFSVLGGIAFGSGRHYWEVEVGSKIAWAVGVTVVEDERTPELTPEMSFWGTVKKFFRRLMYDRVLLVLRDGQYEIHTYKHIFTPLYLPGMIPQKIGVFLDYEGGEVTFYNADDMREIIQVPWIFSPRLVFPYFSPGPYLGGQNADPLKICNN